MFQRLFRTTASPAEQWVSVAHGAVELPVLVRRSARATRYSLRVRAAEQAVVLTIPQRASLSGALAFANRYAGWIAQRIARLPGSVPFEAGQHLPLRGVDHLVVHRSGARGTVWTEVSADGAPLLVVAGAAEHLARRLRDFLRREARRDLDVAVARHAKSLNVTIKKLSIKDTVSRWGSCSSSGNLSFSWRLILAPPTVLDYLAAHEVAHRMEMNHSNRFWTIVRRLDPAMDAAEAWLKRNGGALHRFGA